MARAALSEIPRPTCSVSGWGTGVTCDRENPPHSVGFRGGSGLAHTLLWSSTCLGSRCCEKTAWLGRHFPRYRGRHAVFEVVGGGLPATARIHLIRRASGGDPALHTCCSGHRGAWQRDAVRKGHDYGGTFRDTEAGMRFLRLGGGITCDRENPPQTVGFRGGSGLAHMLL